jgi:hypothetical protein
MAFWDNFGGTMQDLLERLNKLGEENARLLERL